MKALIGLVILVTIMTVLSVVHVLLSLSSALLFVGGIGIGIVVERRRVRSSSNNRPITQEPNPWYQYTLTQENKQSLQDRHQEI